MRMQKLCPDEYACMIAKTHVARYNFFPRTWILPAENTVLAAYHAKASTLKRPPIYIAKPINLAQGKVSPLRLS
jgi:hypothetical protein